MTQAIRTASMLREFYEFYSGFKQSGIRICLYFRYVFISSLPVSGILLFLGRTAAERYQ